MVLASSEPATTICHIHQMLSQPSHTAVGAPSEQHVELPSRDDPPVCRGRVLDDLRFFYPFRALSTESTLPRPHPSRTYLFTMSSTSLSRSTSPSSLFRTGWSLLLTTRHGRRRTGRRTCPRHRRMRVPPFYSHRLWEGRWQPPAGCSSVPLLRWVRERASYDGCRPSGPIARCRRRGVVRLRRRHPGGRLVLSLEERRRGRRSRQRKGRALPRKIPSALPDRCPPIPYRMTTRKTRRSPLRTTRMSFRDRCLPARARLTLPPRILRTPCLQPQIRRTTSSTQHRCRDPDAGVRCGGRSLPTPFLRWRTSHRSRCPAGPRRNAPSSPCAGASSTRTRSSSARSQGATVALAASGSLGRTSAPRGATSAQPISPRNKRRADDSRPSLAGVWVEARLLGHWATLGQALGDIVPVSVLSRASHQPDGLALPSYGWAKV
ncbi:hypothetical protein LXA43DRAFT_667265 [Ganoderma leucocontextum]|nr:hypothetical protein LXA43DRAFT_667265 [Ganoderma leucocontextum]